MSIWGSAKRLARKVTGGSKSSSSSRSSSSKKSRSSRRDYTKDIASGYRVGGITGALAGATSAISDYARRQSQQASGNRGSATQSSYKPPSGIDSPLMGGRGGIYAKQLPSQRLQSYRQDPSAGYAEIDRAKQVYAQAQRSGDTGAMERAHRWANQIREAMGVSSEYDKATGQRLADAQGMQQPIDPMMEDQGFIEDAYDPLLEQAKYSQEARDKLIQARIDEQVRLAQGAERQAQQQYGQQVEDIRGDVYQAQEGARVGGVRAGTQYSAQQRGVEAGIAREGINLEQQARSNRDARLADIKDRIANIRGTGSAQLEASLAQRQAQEAGVMGQQAQAQMARRFAVEDREANFAQAEKMFNLDANLKREFKKEDQEFQVKMFQMDAQVKQAFAQADREFKMKMFQQEQGVKMKLASMQAGAQMALYRMKRADQMKIMQMNRQDKIMFAGLKQEQQLQLMERASHLKKGEMEYQVGMENQKQQKDFMLNFFSNKPEFDMYTQPGVFGKIDEKAIKADVGVMDVMGISKEDQYNLMQGNYDPNWLSQKIGYDETVKGNIRKATGYIPTTPNRTVFDDMYSPSRLNINVGQ